MLIENVDGTVTGGPLDVICILRDVTTERFHVAFFEEKPMPGPVPDVMSTPVVRLKSNMHHTEGAPDLDGAKLHLAEFRAKLRVPDDNVSETPIPWDGQAGIVWLVPNWRAQNRTFRDVAEAIPQIYVGVRGA